MTVKELIEKLSELEHQEWPVLFRDDVGMSSVETIGERDEFYLLDED